MEEPANQSSSEISVDQEIGDVSMGKPHFLLLGAGASKAALPDGDANGKPIPLLRDIAADLDLFKLFPDDLRDLAQSDFEAAFSKLVDVQHENVSELEQSIAGYFSELELPSKPNLYDLFHLCLRGKDAIFTFNWDPFLMQSRIRLDE